MSDPELSLEHCRSCTRNERSPNGSPGAIDRVRLIAATLGRVLAFGLMLNILIDVNGRQSSSPFAQHPRSDVHHAVPRPTATSGVGCTLRITGVFKGVVPVIGAFNLMLIALVIWPEIALWLPGLSASK
ncbi:hypothetical protein [Paenarthrobacter sp. YIM B13468]|uniref:hypothetical protein n=1 Tax=Paenarthrobacter sp. YIM B13468 TaxID=3366295 RepID=UPI003671F0DD